MTDTEEAAESGFWHRVRHRFHRTHRHLHRNPVTGFVTKIVVTILGAAVIGAGLVMMVTPGPGIVAIVVGLGILGTEWHWAQRWMHAMKAKAQAAADKARDMDPKVRRRRLVFIVLGVICIAGAVWAYVATYDWPSFAVTGWDWVQGLSRFVPELPGM
ncbi:MAG: PGPGW domain-containing protein [Nocardioides sp.]|uniref:PGPGW domain-containing protein n=1 Tax=Nocardioides sp. TaxID=35761 RepID=UPI0039E259EE